MLIRGSWPVLHLLLMLLVLTQFKFEALSVIHSMPCFHSTALFHLDPSAILFTEISRKDPLL